MGQIDELDDKLKIIELEPPRTHEKSRASSETIGPEIPDSIADVKERSFDERFAELNRIPLFMRELDETDGSIGENNGLEALKSLAFDGEPWEIATSFKENGNESFRHREYKDAIEYYTKALQTKCGQLEIDEVCYVNRAACNLELQNFGKVLGDCSKALKINPKNLKALYRSTRACIAVDRFEEAQDVLTRGLVLDPENTGMKQQLVILERKLQTALEKRKKDDARLEKARVEARNIENALKQRSISIVKTARPPDTGDARLYLSDPSDVESSLVFPTVFIYPLSYQTDFLAAFAEVYTIQSQLDLILEQSPAWDQSGEYTPKNVDCFMETRTRGLIKLGKKVTLGSVLGSGKVDVLDGIVRIYLVPKSKATTWIANFKQEKELTKPGGT